MTVVLPTRRPARPWMVIVVLCVPHAVWGQPADGQEEPRRGLVWRNRPSFQIGEHIRLDLRFKMQLDWRRFDPEIDEDEFDRHQLRGGLNGEITRHVEFQIEHDLHENGKWRDVYINWRTFRELEVSAGRFKVPFGREELISFSDVDFAYRALVSTTIPPARDRGVMAHGRFFGRGLTYQIGVFKEDGDNGRLTERQFSVTGNPPGIGPSFAGRVTVAPLRTLPDTVDSLRLGFAYGAVDVPEGLNSFRGQTVYGTTEFFPPVYVKGRRERVGLEVSFTPGPFGMAAEWMQAREERRNQGIRDVDLSDLVTTGWYANITWFITGEEKEDFNDPRRSLFRGGIGAVELGARYEKLRFESADKTGPPFRNQRAEHIFPNSDAVWTFGVNWFPNRWVRLVVNAIKETFEDPGTLAQPRTPVSGTLEFWSGVARLQLVF